MAMLAGLVAKWVDEREIPSAAWLQCLEPSEAWPGLLLLLFWGSLNSSIRRCQTGDDCCAQPSDVRGRWDPNFESPISQEIVRHPIDLKAWSIGPDRATQCFCVPRLVCNMLTYTACLAGYPPETTLHDHLVSELVDSRSRI